MLRMHAPTTDYLEAQVRTASPERLHLMVIDAAIRFARQGLEAVEANDRERSFQALSRSRACLSELLAGIKLEPNPELAGQLRSLFTFAHRQLTIGELKHNAGAIRDALTVLELHRETWQELLSRLQSERAPAAASLASSWVT
jgi:flagellar protein FliS